MSEGTIELAEDGVDAGHDPDPESDDRLLTARVLPVTPPPPPYRHATTPPPAYSPGGSFAPPSGGNGHRAADVSIPAQDRTSWWREILTATFPPPAANVRPPLDERVLERRIGATCAGMALGFVIVALAMALRGADTSAVSPAVDAALIVARTAMSLGFLAFGLALLKMGERFFTGRHRRELPMPRPSTPNLN